MNPQAAKELLDLIMLDDFVARRDALNEWSRRWITTMHVEFIHDGTQDDRVILSVAKQTLLAKIWEGLIKDEVGVLAWYKPFDNANKVICEMHCVMQKPRSLT